MTKIHKEIITRSECIQIRDRNYGIIKPLWWKKVVVRCHFGDKSVFIIVLYVSEISWLKKDKKINGKDVPLSAQRHNEIHATSDRSHKLSWSVAYETLYDGLHKVA